MSCINKTALCFVAAFAASSFYAAAASASCPQIGFVTKVNGDDGMYIQRTPKEKVPVYVSTPVCANDKLLTDAAPGSVTVLLADGNPRTYKTGETIDKLQHLEFLAPFAKIVEEFKVKVGRYVTTASRVGEKVPFEFAVSGLTQSRAKLAAGHSRIYVRWAGGVGPYTVTLADAGGTIVYETKEVPGPAVYLDLSKPLGAGRWALTVRSTFGKAIQGGFEVDPSRSYVKADDKERFSEIEAATTAVNLAASDPDWALEADQIFAAAPAQSLDRLPVLHAISCLSKGLEPDACKY